jgi:enamine deaminase RidA (YjgF/YER057c/UK114 family)
MAGRIDARLRELGIVLPEAPPPRFSYVPYVVSGRLVFIAGQVPFQGAELKYPGKIPVDLDVAAGQQAARLCALNILAHLKNACGGDLDRVTRCVKLGGFVNCAEGFGEQPQVINGASDLMVSVFGEIGRHARFAVGAVALPLNVSVEIDAVFEIAA